jgi:hypothetical protein
MVVDLFEVQANTPGTYFRVLRRELMLPGVDSGASGALTESRRTSEAKVVNLEAWRERGT